ncbi:endonuclease/exonuclease/phosphatase family protein [Pedosphaera parvula]|uniref:Endonuclease/exonuclease/phosphatase n=1 Tax=Pedosphaera parvula (strain Ellin514) TaxID=320771 RepID=B9XMG3_PEDPL|nr:endonuclease/exonuclease/phosphatase family protein [Pedosphaera parvula]EEF59005.1 hypothetical protein Cflav_PD2054 [Pedosphaera parvula Ellin514]
MNKNAPLTFYARGCWLACLAFCFCLLNVQADTIRLTTWNFAPVLVGATNVSPQQVTEIRLQEAAVMLKNLHPDVILLQQVTDWNSCKKLAQYLKPETYRVLTCSSFKSAGGAQQVAILSRNPALIAWSEPWKNRSQSVTAGGFAFAAIRLGNKNVGFFTIQQGDAASAKQLLGQIDSFRNWTANRAEAMVIAGNFVDSPKPAHTNGPRILEEAGLVGRAAEIAQNAGRKPAGDYLFLKNAGFANERQISSDVLSSRQLITYDLELDPAKIMVAETVRPEPLPAKVETTETQQAETPVVLAEPVPKAVGQIDFRWLWGGAAIVLFLVVIIIWNLAMLSRRKANSNVVPMIPEGANDLQTWQQRALLAERRADEANAVMREGLLPHLSHWLKEKLVRKLLSQRAELMETQQAAALRALAIDERLAKIESQIQQRNEIYEQRIDELTEELKVAKEENRELIRAKIALVRAEMEKDRTKSTRYREN